MAASILRLVSAVVRRRLPKEEFRGLVEPPATDEQLQHVLNAFSSANATFLLVGASVTVSHESLFRIWPKAKQWIEEEQKGGKLYGDVRNALDRERQWSGVRLAEVQEWWNKERPTAAWADRYGGRFDEVDRFLARSRLFRRLRGLAYAAVVVVCAGFAITFGILRSSEAGALAVAKSAEAKAKTEEGEVRAAQQAAQTAEVPLKLAARSELIMTQAEGGPGPTLGDVVSATGLAIESMGLRQSDEGKNALRRALSSSAMGLPLKVEALPLSPPNFYIADREHVATTKLDHGTVLVGIADGRARMIAPGLSILMDTVHDPKRRFLLSYSAPTNNIPAANTIVAADGWWLLDLPSRTVLRGQEDGLITGFVISADAKYFGMKFNRPSERNLNNPITHVYSADPRGPAKTIEGDLLAFHPDSQRGMVRKSDYSLALIDLRTGTEKPIKNEDASSQFSGFTSDGQYFAVSRFDQFHASYAVYRVDSLAPVRRESGSILAMSDDGKILLVAGDGVRLVDTETGAVRCRLSPDGQNPANALALPGDHWEISPGSSYIVAERVGAIKQDFFDAKSGELVSSRQVGTSFDVAWFEGDQLALTVGRPAWPTAEPYLLYRNPVGEKDPIRMACGSMPRNPNEQEWRDHFQGLGPYREICEGLPNKIWTPPPLLPLPALR